MVVTGKRAQISARHRKCKECSISLIRAGRDVHVKE